MNYQDKTKDELIKELQKLQLDYDSLKTSYEKDITERRLAEEALPEPGILYKELMDLARDVIFSLTPQGLFGSMNQAFDKITGWQTQEWIGKPFTDLLHPEDIPLAAERFSNLLKGRTAQAIELRIRKKSGDYACTEVLASPRMKRGMIIGLLGIARDITKRNQTEHKLRENEARFRSYFDLPLHGIAITSPEKGWIEVNSRICSILGYTRDELAHITWADITHPDDLAADDKQFNCLLSGEIEQYTLDKRFIRKDGVAVWTSIAVGCVRESDGKVDYVVAYMEDITERKQAEEALRESEERFQRLSQGLFEGIIIHDKGKIIDANEAFAAMSGYDLSELIGKNVLDFATPELREIAERHIRTESEEPYEGMSLRKEGSMLYVEVRGKNIPYEGRMVRVTALVDITERKLTEDVLRQSEMKLKTLFEVLPIGVSILNAERNVVFVNPALETILSITKDGFIRGDYKSRKYLRPDGTQMPEEEYASVRAFREQRTIHDVETGVLMEDGHVIWTNVNAAPVAFPDWKVVIITMDITERKLIEETLRESEDRFKRLYQQAPLGYQSLDTEGCFIDVNQAWLDMLGYSRDEVIRRWFGDFLAPQEVDAFKQRFQCFKATGEVHVDLEMVQRTGSKILVHIDGKTGHNEHGQFKQTHCILHDITGRKQAEEALHLEKENFRHSLDDSPLGVRIVTAEGDTIYANQTILNFYGYDSLGELQRTPLKDRYTPASYVQAQKRKHQRERGDLSASDYEISIVRKNGEIRHLQVFRKEVLWDGVRQFQILYNDITERKKDEEEIRKSKKLLEDLHIHLNEILENERALISREIHDQIGQSLTALKLDLNWMNKYTGSEPEAVTKLQGMIELISKTIKDVQRISSDLRPGILDDLGLAAAIEWYCDEFEKRTAVRCILKLDDSIFRDSRKNLVFFRVLQEALTNVIRHANASSVTIKLHQTQRGTTLTIQDNGIGITAEMIESTKALGLIGMRERVRQFNGKIDISSKKGDGTKLTIFIPS
jgi:PAS domain S-box-containing protein